MIKADLQTAQNQMFLFVENEMNQLEKENYIQALNENPEMLKDLYILVRELLFDLLSIPEEKRSNWHMGITDSGKRAIELLVNLFCVNQPHKNAVVPTENYVAFNKFSAATALLKQKAIECEKPFDLKAGQALTINSDLEFKKAKRLIKHNKIQTLWIAWNSTSTGIQERVEKLVAFRNRCESQTLIIADAASLRLLTKDWENIPSENLPDSFFFSFRKQGIPYDGPQDEFHQAQNSGAVFIFNDKAAIRATEIDANPIHNCPKISDITKGEVPYGDQRINHIKHLLKLKIVLNYFLENDRSKLEMLDRLRDDTRSKILKAFSKSGNLNNLGFSLLADPDRQSSSTYIFKIPENYSAQEIISTLTEKGIHVSSSKHPDVDHKKYIRFAFYPGNSPEEISCLLSELYNYANMPVHDDPIYSEQLIKNKEPLLKTAQEKGELILNESILTSPPDSIEWIERVKDNSVNNYKLYGNCTQSLLAAFLEEFKIELPLLLKSSGALHAGLLSSLTCGIYIAGMMVLGIFMGREKIEQGLDGLIPIIEPGHELMKRLKSRIGSHSCKELTGVDFTDMNQAIQYYCSDEIHKCFNRLSMGAEEIANFLNELSIKGELYHPLNR
ncbi:MAG: C-GCAxxG-C-C family protein [Desulfobacterales bacterium]